MSVKHEKYINMAVKLAKKNVEKNAGGPFAAIVVKDCRVVSYGYNQVTSKNDPTLHAEIDALRKAAKKLRNFNLKECVIYTSCQPCPMCLAAIYWANIKKIYYAATKETASKYGFRDGKIYEELKNKVTSLKMININLRNSSDPFKLWNGKKDKIKY